MVRSMFIILAISIINPQFDCIIKSEKDLNAIMEVNMEKAEEKIQFIKKTLDIGEKYSFKEGNIFLKYIIIGEWNIPPHEGIIFYKNNRYFKKNYDTNYQENGVWKMEGNKLFLIKSSKEWKYYIIDHFILEYSDFSSLKYSFFIQLINKKGIEELLLELAFN